MYLFVYLFLEFFSVFFFYHTIRRNLSSLTAQVSANYIQNIQNVVTDFYFLLSSKHRIGHNSPVILKAKSWSSPVSACVARILPLSLEKTSCSGKRQLRSWSVKVKEPREDTDSQAGEHGRNKELPSFPCHWFRVDCGESMHWASWAFICSNCSCKLETYTYISHDQLQPIRKMYHQVDKSRSSRHRLNKSHGSR